MVASASTQQLQEIKAKLEQCKAELNSTTEGEEGDRAGSISFREEMFFKLGPSGASSNIISLTPSYIPLTFHPRMHIASLVMFAASYC